MKFLEGLALKVLIVLPSYDSGGAENYALRLVSHLGCKEFEWHVTSGKRKNNSMVASFEKESAITHFVSTVMASPVGALRFYKFLLEERFDAIMTFTGVFGGPALFLSWCAGVKNRVAWHRRSTPAYKPSFLNRAYAWLSLNLLSFSSTKILSNSIAALDCFHPDIWKHSSRFQVVHNGVSSERFKRLQSVRERLRRELGLSDEDYVIGHVGRFDPAKDHASLLAIVKKLRASSNQVKLLTVGSGTDSQEFAGIVSAQGLVDVCFCLGLRSDIEELYSAMDVFLFTSVTEGQPNALIEAMLCEVPVIATNISSIKATVPDSLHGYLFSPGDVQAGVNVVSHFLSEVPYSVRVVRKWAGDRYDLESNFKIVRDLLVR